MHMHSMQEIHAKESNLKADCIDGMRVAVVMRKGAETHVID